MPKAKKCLPCVLHGEVKLFLFLIEGGRGEDAYFLIRAKGRLDALMKANPRERYEEYLIETEPAEGKKHLSYPKWVASYGRCGTQLHEITEAMIIV